MTQSKSPALPKPSLLPEKVFVYGTLKRGFHNNHYLDGCQFLGAGVTEERYPLIGDGLPYLLNKPGHGHRVSGELYQVPHRILIGYLDGLEGHPLWYKRRHIGILASNDRHEAWVYFLRIAPQNWRKQTSYPEYKYRPMLPADFSFF